MNTPDETEDFWDDDPFADDIESAPRAPFRATQNTDSAVKTDDFADANSVDIESADDEMAQELLPAEKQNFVIESASDASWVVRKIVEARARQQRIKDWAAQETADAKREESFFLRRFGPELEAWTAENNGGKKSLRLPDGTLGFRNKRATIQIRDEDRVLDWCRDNLPDAVKVSESILKTPLNEHLKETGEIPPGCGVEGGEEFFVR